MPREFLVLREFQYFSASLRLKNDHAGPHVQHSALLRGGIHPRGPERVGQAWFWRGLVAQSNHSKLVRVGVFGCFHSFLSFLSFCFFCSFCCFYCLTRNLFQPNSLLSISSHLFPPLPIPTSSLLFPILSSWQVAQICRSDLGVHLFGATGIAH